MFGFALLMATLFASERANAGMAEEIEVKWRREYPRAAAELERTAQAFLAKGKFTYRALFGETHITGELTVASSGDKSLYIADRRTIESQEKMSKPIGSVVRSRTPEYVFELTKEAPEDHYVLAYYADKFLDKIKFDYDYDIFSRCATVYMQQTLLSRMQSPSFVVRAAENLRDADRDVVRIDYTYDSGHHTETGAVYLDPGQNWAIRRVDVVTRSEKMPHYEFKSDVDYQQVGDHIYLPKRVEFFGRTQYPDIYDHGLLELGQITAGDVNPGIFLLTAYGLPDIPLRAIRGSSAFSFRNPLFWGSLVVAIISFALLRITKSPRGKTSTTPTP